MIRLGDLENRIQKLESSVAKSGYVLKETLAVNSNRAQRLTPQDTAIYGMQVCLCVSTLDPLKRGRIKIYHPSFYDNKISDLSTNWASPISVGGCFDDAGGIFVPPAGSKVAVLFHNGDPNDAYYVGGVWDGHRGSDGEHLPYWYNYPYMQEYNCLYDGKRNGYLVGDNTGDQVLPPWNTESYFGYDQDTVGDFYNDPTQQLLTTVPHISGIKTPGKHSIKMDDGDPYCNYRYKRFELNSSRGNFIIMKDDHLHPSQQYAFSNNLDNLIPCQDPNSEVPLEFPCCTDSSAVPQACVNVVCPPSNTPGSVTSPSVNKTNQFSNPFFKRQEEMRPHLGAPNPQNNKCNLPQSGIQFQSLSGHQFVLDDSVNQPTGVPDWQLDFNYGCDGVYRGKVYITSAHGHLIQLDDSETAPFVGVRDEANQLLLKSALGNKIALNDHTIPGTQGTNSCPPGFAGSKNGIFMRTVCDHVLEMSNEGLQFCGDVPRKSQDDPLTQDEINSRKATQPGFNGYVKLRTGYGLQLLMQDKDIQSKTSNQFITLTAPQTTNTVRGPHLLGMQESETGAGAVFLRSGGVYYNFSYDASIEVVGTPDQNPASKFSTISQNYLIDAKGYYYLHAKNAMILSDDKIFLLAGKDCDRSDSPTAEELARQAEIRLANETITQLKLNIPLIPEETSDSKTPCPFSAITSKDGWTCPVTGFIHYGLGTDSSGKQYDSRSNRVFIS